MDVTKKVLQNAIDDRISARKSITMLLNGSNCEIANYKKEINKLNNEIKELEEKISCQRKKRKTN